MRAIVTVIGNDCTGIIYNVSKVLSQNNVNIEDINQTVMHDIFTMVMLVDLKKMTVDFGMLKKELEDMGKAINISVRVQHEDLFNAMHTI